jgi:hypothetical protein
VVAAEKRDLSVSLDGLLAVKSLGLFLNQPQNAMQEANLAAFAVHVVN